MRASITGPIAGLLTSAVAAWALLQRVDLVAGWLPQPLVSGAYDMILLCLGASFAWLLLRLTRPNESPAETRTVLTLGPWSTTRLLAIVAASLVWINLFDYLLKLAVSYRYPRVMPLFALEQEGNLPTLFSTVLLLAGALLLSLVAKATPRGERDRFGWIALALLFAYLALDEFAGLHEQLAPVGKRLLSGPGPFAREWLVIYGALLLPLALLMLPFVRRLPRRLRIAWAVAAVVFLSGAAGLEILAGWHDLSFDSYTPVRALLNISKEALEMAGVLIFLHALLEHIEAEFGRLALLGRRA